MSRTPGNSDDDLTVPLALESSGPTLPLSDDPTGTPAGSDLPSVLIEAGEASPAFDSELFAQEAEAARNAGEGRRADALVCARALLAERQDDGSTALSLWRGAFDHDPSLLVAFWGLRRSLVRLSAWQELPGILDRRIKAVFSHERREDRADLWLEHGRILEDRLGRADDAGRSYRAGLIELPDHPGLLTSLFLLGMRRDDPLMTAEALSGLLRRPLPPAIRVSTAVRLARLERGARASGGGVGGVAVDPAVDPVNSMMAARALDTLRTALRTVGHDSVGPLLVEMSLLARATADPRTRAEILGELVARLPVDDPTRHLPSDADSDVGSAIAVPLLRERARLLRDNLDDPEGAVEALRTALARSPGHAIVIAELADLVEAQAGKNRGEAARGLQDLLTVVAQRSWPDRTTHGAAERQLLFRTLVALAADGRSDEGLAMLARDPRLPRDSPDFLALEMFLRTDVGDTAGLASIFELLGEKLSRATGGDLPDRSMAAHALVVAGVLRERSEGAVAGAGGDEIHASSTRLYRRATEIAPDHVPALDAVERRLWAGRHWRELSEFWEGRLSRLRSKDPGPVMEVVAAPGPNDVDQAEATRLLENLVAIERDFRNDPIAAGRYQDDLVALGGSDARGRVRRHDLELAAAARGVPSSTATRVGLLRELADCAGAPAIEAALRIEGARVAVAGGDAAAARVLFTQALPDDDSGAARSGLERLAGGAGAATDAFESHSALRADVVRDEIDQLGRRNHSAGKGAEREEVLRALRFRVAWHLRAARRPREAVDALQPLRAAGDPLARAWSWEIARRSDDHPLQVMLLRALALETGRHDARLDLPADLGEALERAGDLSAAENAFREAALDVPGVDAALGLLRVGAALRKADVVLEATRALAACGDAAMAPALSRETALLTLLQGGATESAAVFGAPEVGDSGLGAMDAVLRWAQGSRGPDVLGAAVGLLAFARALPVKDSIESKMDRNGLFARAAARARLGGVGLSGAVHDQVASVATAAPSISVALADLPVAGRPARIAARIARAERGGGHLAYALDIERALDCEARGDSTGALDGFTHGLARDAAGLEALDGIKRLALATGDRLGAARAGIRLGALLRTPARASAELAMAGQILNDLGMTAEATIAYWHALARDPGSQWLYESLRDVLGARQDEAGLDRLYGLRLSVLADGRSRVALLLERATHRLTRMGDRPGAIEDFKRTLKIDPDESNALRHLATLATQMEHFPQAVRFLERLVAVRDGPAVANLRLELAEAHEAARDPARAVEVLRQAVTARPRDTAPWQRLTDLLLRMGDWSGALATLRGWDAVLDESSAKAEIWIRIGSLLRDHGRDTAAAAAAFAKAADLDPLGAGIPELVVLHQRSGAIGARQDALDRAVIDMRQALAVDPLHIPRLRRLQELYQLSMQGGQSASAASSEVARAAVGATAVGQILALVGEDVESWPRRRGELRGTLSPAFWGRLRPPSSSGFVAEIWPTLAAAATEVFPTPAHRPWQRDRVAPGSEPRLAWVEAAARAVGLPTLDLGLLRSAPGAGDTEDASVIPLEDSPPAILVGRGALAGDGAARFRVGRALALLHDRTVIFDRIADVDVDGLLVAAGVLAGASSPEPQSQIVDFDARVKALGKALSRKDRRTLELEASRFGFESIDGARFRHSALTSADRLGLVLAGDVAVSVRVAAGLDAEAGSSLPPAAIAADRRALELIRFALSEDYLRLIADVGFEEG
jgi:tetratricopeptide (TPR) repeat protein